MKVEQIYTGCLAEAAYYIESNGEAAVIDPLRDIEGYLQRAEEDNAQIKYIFLTHFHADFMAGHMDLAKKTGGTIIVGPTEAPIGYDAHIVKDDEVLPLGDVNIKVLHTPGHTTESVCYLLSDEKGKDVGLFSGDTLFIGDVGRPDLAQKVVADLTQDKLARMLFHSLRNKIMPLNDDIIVYPNHGAGSPCGKNMSDETTDTLGNQKKTNYALRPDQTEDEFVKELLSGLKEPPSYFPAMVLGNIKGTESIYDVRKRENNALSADAFEKAAQEEGVSILDTRSSTEFVKGFIPKSINIDIESNFAVWAGTIFRDVNSKLLVVTYPGREQEVIDRLARVGFDHVVGFINGGYKTWEASGKPTDTLTSVTPEEVAKLGSVNFLDVRRESEYDSEHIVDAINAPLDYHWDSVAKVEKDKTYHVYCRSGNRSVIYASILKAQGYDNLIDIAGGIEEMKKTEKFKLTEYVCPSTML